ncbi:MAG: HD-GYP domain-containing protein [Syntrophorhabdaceae bacterium]|nr:HD-GYP domain-containing protein [Syntrophorhabdaceae bacterium]
MDRRQMETTIAGIVRLLGASLKNRGLYPPSHPLVKSPIWKCVAELAPLFANRAELVLTVVDDTLVLEGVPIFHLTSSLELFLARLGSIGVPALVFEKEMTTEDLERFMLFLHETKEQGLSTEAIKERLSVAGIKHIYVTEREDTDDFANAQKVYNNAISVVAKALNDVRNGQIPDGASCESAVREINGMLLRNRDAMLALTLIKNFDEYTYNHSVNVSVLALAVTENLGLPEQSRINVGVAGLLHDIGKTQLALDLIQKPGTLTISEYEEIKKHPEAGFVILEKMTNIQPETCSLVREHHMRFDRAGYPTPDPGAPPHPYSQVIAVADCYDALTSTRSYQKARTPQNAIEIMRKLSGKSLDPDLVTLLERSLGIYPIGTLLRLNTMEVGIVTKVPEGGKGNLEIAILYDRAGNPLPKPEAVDLSEVDPTTGKPRRTTLGTVNPMLLPPIPFENVLESTSS